MRPADIDRRTLLKLLAAGALYPWAGNALANSTRPPLSKPIPSSGELLPLIGIGTSRVFEVGDDRQEREGPRQTLETLQAWQGAMIDTSPMYGQAETVIGDLLRASGQRKRFFLATKVWTRGRQSGIAQMNDSFLLMGADTIDLMQIHNLVDWRTHLHTLRDWKASGRLRYIGITHYREDAHDALAKVITAAPDLDFLQVNYSLLEPAAEQALLPLAREKGIAVIANRPFGRGGWFSMTRGRAIPEWAGEFGINSWAQFALKWIVSHPAINCAIPGTGKARHMLDNMQAAYGPLPDAAMRERMQTLMLDL